jgi:hypothetical protein
VGTAHAVRGTFNGSGNPTASLSQGEKVEQRARPSEYPGGAS